VVPAGVNNAPDAVLLVATNPVDVMTHVSALLAAEMGMPSARVIGSGTTLDTARFRALLSRHVGVDAQHVHAYVLGEHGDSEVLAWSAVGIGGVPLQEYSRQTGVTIDAETRQRIDEGVRRAAFQIIAGKKATYYGIGSALARIVRAIILDERAILTVCSPLAEVAGVKDVTVSVPHLVGGQGILGTLPVPLDESERTLLRASATIIRDAIGRLNVVDHRR
jgi:L-lactate dehydrogenase